MLNILHLCAGNLYGGIERVLITYAEQRNRCPEMVPHFGLCFEGRLQDELRAAGVPVHMFGNVRLSRPWTAWRARKCLSNLVNYTQTFDAIVVHTSWPYVVFGPTIRRNKIPLLFVAHDAFLNMSRLDKLAARAKPNRVIANSAFTASTVSNLFPDTPVDVCHNPLLPLPPTTPESRQEVRASLGCPSDRAVIISCARLEEWKGHSLLIEALGRLKGNDWETWIIGGAQRPEEQVYLESLTRKTASLGLQERVRFLGQRSDVARMLGAADIYCQPNLGPEPFGIAFVEAMSAGLPVATTKLGAPADYIDASCGQLVPPKDAEALAAVLQHWIDSPADRRAVGSSGPVRADELCNVDRQLHLLYEIIEGETHRAGRKPVAVGL